MTHAKSSRPPARPAFVEALAISRHKAADSRCVDLFDRIEVDSASGLSRWARLRPLARPPPMTNAIDPVELASRLIACPSVTPASGAVFDVLEAMLTPLGFEVHRFAEGEPPDGPVENLFATRGDDSGPHFGFAGHLDVGAAGRGWSPIRSRRRCGEAATRPRRGRHEGRDRGVRRGRGRAGSAERQAQPADHRDEEGPASTSPGRSCSGWTHAASRPEIS